METKRDPKQVWLFQHRSGWRAGNIELRPLVAAGNAMWIPDYRSWVDKFFQKRFWKLLVRMQSQNP